MEEGLIRKIVQSKYFNISVLAFVSLLIVGLLSSFVLKLMVQPESEESKNANLTYKPYKIEYVVQVNVLNASGETGKANVMRQYLRKKGFDVVEIGNYKKIVDKSFLIDRAGDTTSIKNIQNVLGIADNHIKREIDPKLFVKSTIIIGKDFAELIAFN